MGLLPTMHTRGAVHCDLRKGEENAWQSRERHWAVTESWIPTFSVFSVYSPCIRQQGNKSYSVPHVQVHLSGCNTSLLILRISFGMTFFCSSWNEVLQYYTLPIPHTPVGMHVSLSKTMGLRISFHFPLNETKRHIRKKSAYLWHTRAESISKLQKHGWPLPLCPPLTQFLFLRSHLVWMKPVISSGWRLLWSPRDRSWISVLSHSCFSFFEVLNPSIY